MLRNDRKFVASLNPIYSYFWEEIYYRMKELTINGKITTLRYDIILILS